MTTQIQPRTLPEYISQTYFYIQTKFHELSHASSYVQKLASKISTFVQALPLNENWREIPQKILHQVISLFTSASKYCNKVYDAVTPRKKEATINHVRREISHLFTRSAKEIYLSLFQETSDLNAQYQGWTLLHYCIYLFSYKVRETPKSLLSFYAGTCAPPPDPIEQGNELLDFIEYLIQHGADLDIEDEYGRTPLYFASTLYECQEELNQRYWNILSCKPDLLCPQNKKVYPLHTVASLSEKFVIDLIEQGAELEVFDQYKRTPLHCATMNSQFDEKFYNVKALVFLDPQSLEYQDQFGCYPLFYAAIFGSEECFDFVLSHSSFPVIEAVFAQLEEKFPKTEQELQELETEYKVYDPIYNVPAGLKVYFGAGYTKKAKKQTVQEKINNKKKEKFSTYTSKEGVTYDTYHDGHGWKHVIHPKIYEQKFSQKRDFIKSTKQSPAKFFPACFQEHTYEKWVELCMQKWVEHGADSKQPYVWFQESIGADNGNETSIVQIYFTDSGGVHIRPKYLSES